MKTIIHPIDYGKGQLFDSTLPNGLRVMTIPHPSRTHFHLEFRMRAGSYHDGEIRGGHHYFEHLLAPDSRREERTRLAEQSIHIHLWTGTNNSHYELDANAEQFSKSLDALVDMLFKPDFNPANVEMERSIILNEELLKHRHFVRRARAMKWLYPDEAGLHHPVVGFPEDINRITSEDLTALYARHFHPKNLLCLATGKVEHHTLLAELERSGLTNLQTRPEQVTLPNLLKVKRGRPFRLKKWLQYGSPYIEMHTTVSDNPHEQIAFRLGLKALCDYMHGPIYQEWRFQQRKMYGLQHSCTVIPDHTSRVETTLYESDHEAFRDFFWKCAHEAPSSPVFHKALAAVLNDLDTNSKRRKTRPFNGFKSISDARDLFHKERIDDPEEWRLVTPEEVAEATRKHWSPNRCTIIRGVRRGF